MMTEQERIELAWRTGHFRNPAKPDALNVTKSDLSKLVLSDEPARQATASLQEFMRPTLDVYCLVHHSRLAEFSGDEADGVWGPATDMLSNRCMCPDYAMTVSDDPEVAPLWNNEEANWPDSCRNDLRFGRDFDSLPGLSKADTDGVYHAMANNLDAVLMDVEITPDLDRDPSGARGWDKLERMSGSTLAWNVLAQNNCGVRLQGAWNSNVRWDKRLGATTGTHEKEHWLGANHSNDPNATIYPSITPVSLGRYGFLHISDIRILVALGYKAYPDWERRKPSLENLFKPRGENTPEGIDLRDVLDGPCWLLDKDGERVTDVESAVFGEVLTTPCGLKVPDDSQGNAVLFHGRRSV